MGLRHRVEKIARETAIQAASQLLATRYQQIQNNSSPVGKVKSAEGVNLKVELADGSTQSIIASGNRPVGEGSVGIILNGVMI